jgi:hypothetical protein
MTPRPALGATTVWVLADWVSRTNPRRAEIPAEIRPS